jgi:hypothetical protein
MPPLGGTMCLPSQGNGDRMGNAGSLLTTVVIILCVLGLAAGGGLYLRQSARASNPVRLRRLAFVERTSLDGGRQLLLVRRDDVEHLILIGGPIDLIVETGIRSEALASVFAKEESYPEPVATSPIAPAAWQLRDHSLSTTPQTAAEPRLSVSPLGDSEADMLHLTALHEAKVVQ